MHATPAIGMLLVTLFLPVADVSPGFAADATGPLRPPSQLVGVAAKPGNKKITLTWTVTDPAVTSCRVYRSFSAGGELPTPIAEVPKSGDASYSYTDIGLTNHQRYFYQITAVNDAGESAPSPEVMATPMNAPPTITQPATAANTLVTGKTVRVSVGATDDGPESELTYSWICNSLGNVYFDPDKTHASKTTAFFTESGTYPLEVVVADADGACTISAVSVTVQQTPTMLRVLPAHPPAIPPGQTWCFRTEATDQFGQWMNSDNAVWRVVTGKGTITRDGLFKAPSQRESDTIAVRLGEVEKTASVLISLDGPEHLAPAEPTQETLASAKFTIETGAWTPSTAYVGQTITSSVTGHLTPTSLDDDTGATFVTYAWAVDGISYSPDGKVTAMLLHDDEEHKLPQGQPSTLVELQLKRPGVYYVKVTGTATVHSYRTGAILAKLSGSGVIGENPHGTH